MPLFAATIFLSAFLLFLVQPLIGKFILPWFGGANGVWTTCILFFQVVLVLGYSYAHAIDRFLKPRLQLIVHLALLAGAFYLLPIIPSDSWKPAEFDQPVWRILALLTVTLGLPYLALSATGPLLQAWFGRVYPGRSPYRLYALSNVASMLALGFYPFYFEPRFGRIEQAQLWSHGFRVFAVLCALAAVVNAFRSRKAETSHTSEVPTSHDATFGRMLMWLILPAAASMMMLAITNQVCQEVAVIPFLWVMPLAIYLLTFVIAFDRASWYRRWIFMPLLGVAIASLILLQLAQSQILRIGITVQLVGYGLSLFLVAMSSHGELYRLRPGPSQLTLFYLMISIGGALGGLFVAVVAPIIFTGFHEVFIAAALATCVLIYLLMTDSRPMVGGLTGRAVFAAVMVALLATLGVFSFFRSSEVIDATRNFYGALRIKEYTEPGSAQSIRTMDHGHISHGAQVLNWPRRPTLYYTSDTGIGMAVDMLPRSNRRIGVVGLGVGTMAAFGKKNDVIHFFEINPEVERLARKYFTFLSQSDAKVDVIPGDARLMLEAAENLNLDMLTLDAFTGDAIPVHTLTREAFDHYRRHLKPDGLITVNVSNRHLDLEPVIRRVADEFGWTGRIVRSYTDAAKAQIDSLWIILSPDESRFREIDKRKNVRPLKPPLEAVPIWTDDATSLFRILKSNDATP